MKIQPRCSPGACRREVASGGPGAGNIGARGAEGSGAEIGAGDAERWDLGACNLGRKMRKYIVKRKWLGG